MVLDGIGRFWTVLESFERLSKVWEGLGMVWETVKKLVLGDSSKNS